MSTTNYLLSRHSNPEQLTISHATKQKFIASGIFQEKTDSNGFDHLTIPASKYLRIDFLNCIFNKIPNKLNTTAFLEYLGVKNATAKKILTDTSVRTHGMTDGESLLHQLRSFAGGLGNTLDSKFFTDDIISDVNRLKHMASQTPALMNNYLAHSTSKNRFSELTDFDYLSKIYSERIANLNCLDRAIDQYLSM